MSKRMRILGSACNMIGGLIGVLGWLLRFARLMLAPKAVLAAKLLAAKSQLVACTDAIERKDSRWTPGRCPSNQGLSPASMS